MRTHGSGGGAVGLLLGLLLGVGVAPAAAQVQDVTVLGVGRIAFDLAPGVSIGQAQSYTYRVYVPWQADEGQIVDVTCAPGPRVIQCTFPIAALELVEGQAVQIGLTTSLEAADGVRTSAKARAPFALLLGVPPADPVFGDVATSILPADP